MDRATREDWQETSMPESLSHRNPCFQNLSSVTKLVWVHPVTHFVPLGNKRSKSYTLLLLFFFFNVLH